MKTNALLTENEITKLQDILIEQLAVEREQISPGARITDDLGADSLAEIEIAMAVEDAFSVEIPDSDLEQVVTVEDLLELLGKTLKR